MSTAPSLPYFSYDESTHKLLGADGGIVNEIAKMECLKTAVQVLTGASALQAVLSKRADISVGGWYKTAERAKVVGQTVPMYYDFSAIISKKGFKKASQLKGMTVGCVQGSLFVAPLQKLLGAGNVRLYQLSDAVYQDLTAGRIQAAILGSGEGGYLLKQRGGGFILQRAEPEQAFPPSLTAGAVDLPHTLGNTALGHALDDDITLLRANGTVQRILKQWGFNNPNNFKLQS
jgi:polar amino acid transport system substrate-binding protein